MKSVYSAVRTGDLNKAVCASFFKGLNIGLNPICHLLALLGGTTIVVVSRLRVKAGNDLAEGTEMTWRKALKSPLGTRTKALWPLFFQNLLIICVILDLYG
jgi:hypothetical protein